MHAMILVTLTCWACVLIASPRKPRVGDEAAELVYRRLLGRQQRLALLAFVATTALLLTVVLSLPQRVNATPDTATTSDTAPMSVALSSGGCNDEMLCLSMYQPPQAGSGG
jgi:hypothetical protein